MYLPTMLAMVLTAPHQLELQNIDEPQIGPGQVLVKMSHSGICGTDLSIYAGHMPVKHPRIMGHEMAGDVVAGGDGSFRPGDKVIVDPSLACGVCSACRAGLVNLCPQGGLIGRERNGGFAEYVAVAQSQLFRLPDSIEFRHAPMIQVLSTCVHAQKMAGIFPGNSVVINGLGVTGQLHVQLSKARGASPLIGISRSSWKRNLAEKFGATVTLPQGREAARKIEELTDGGADIVIDCTGQTSVIAECVHMTRPGGTLVLYGTATETQSNLSFYDMYFKEIRVLNTRASTGRDFPPSIDLVAGGVVQLEPLITACMPLADLGLAMQEAKKDSAERLKIILKN